MAKRVTQALAGQARAGRSPPLALLGAMSALGALGTHTLMPALPVLVREFHTTPDRVQMTISVFLISIGLSQIAVGPLADRFGRRAVLLAGLGLFTLASIGCAFAASIGMLIVGRVLQGSSSCAGLVVARLLLRDLFSSAVATSRLGFINTCVSVVPTSGPIVGGLLFESFGWTGVFWFLALIGFAVLICAFFLVPDSKQPASTAPLPPVVRGYVTLLRNSEFLCFFAMIGTVTGIFYAFASGAPYIGERFLRLQPAEYGVWFAPVAFGNSLGALLAGKLAARIPPTRLLFIASIILLTGSGLAIALLLAGHRAPLFLFGPMSLANIGTGLIMPGAIMAAVSVVPGIAGTSAGLVGLSQFGSAALFSFIAGVLVQRSASTLPLLMLILAMTIALVMLSRRIARSAQQRKGNEE